MQQANGIAKGRYRLFGHIQHRTGVNAAMDEGLHIILDAHHRIGEGIELVRFGDRLALDQVMLDKATAGGQHLCHTLV